MIDSKVLLKELQKQVTLLEQDLTPTGLADARLNLEWRAAKSADRTAATFETWLADRVTQVAVAWVLGTVFLRFCEDNGLIEYPYLSGPRGEGEDRLALAADLQAEYFQKHPERTDRDWIIAGFEAMSVSPVAKGLFDRRHNPMWEIQPANDAAKGLLAFWRQTGPDGGVLHDFTDPAWETRFLGDLYQDLSEHAKKTFALLQTPEFVEEFILKYTLDPAIEEFGLTPEPPSGHEDLPNRLRVIDPACGSGHFLLGAFRKLLAAWEAEKPQTDKWELIREALGSVHGVDKNSFAVAIARFRLLLAAMKAGGVARLDDQVDFPLNIAVGDSLLHGKGAPGRQVEFEFGGETSQHTYRTEDVDDYIKSVHILEVGTYHVVVANPPYITVKDKAENESYRKAYKDSCSGKYALSAPFAERIFTLAIRGGLDGKGAGYTGQITANSFMKREFGKKLIEEYFPKVDLTHVIDTSGAYIPGHGTPTVILFGRRRTGRSDTTIRGVLGVRGEPGQPEDPAKGYVWQAIADQVDRAGSESEWVSVADLPRGQLAAHPWSLSGGGASEVTEMIGRQPRQLVSAIDNIGMTILTLEDDAYVLPLPTASRLQFVDDCIRLVVGDEVRDFGFLDGEYVLMPQRLTGERRDPSVAAECHLWRFRVGLAHRLYFGQVPEERGMRWFDIGMFFPKRHVTPLSIAFAFVASHNHFVLDRGGKVFKQSAPVIKLPESATEDDHLALLGVLNSSTACFWLKQVSHDKGNGGYGGGIASEEWERFFEFTGTKLEQFPLTSSLPLGFGRQLDSLAEQLAETEPSAVCASGVPTRDLLDAARVAHERIRGRMIALQEELDWDVYRRYGLLTEEQAAELAADPADVPELKLGERAFEIVLARRVASGEAETQWFARHRSTPVTEISEHWPEAYRQVVQRRIDMIERDRNIGLIERPECKRRWQSEPWEAKEKVALTTWLLDRCEQRSLWFEVDGEPVAMTVNRLADRLRTEADVVSVARLLAGPDADLGNVLKGIIANEHVPAAAHYRYKHSGLDKRRQWERTWDQQREEDRTGKRLDIPVPPKYAGIDFQKQSYWRHRGKLDVPKERFISYPDASPDSDSGSLLIGWAGWDHREQAAALISLIQERSEVDGWETDRLMGLLVALLEVMPWVRQWHGEATDFGESYADAYDGYLTTQRESRNLTEAALRAWLPSQPTRGRKRQQ